MAEVHVLDVLLHGEPIGTLTRVAGDRTLFAFNEAYINGQGRATLSLGFKDSLGELKTDFNTTQTKLLPFFSNLLPEGHLRSYLAERAGVSSVRDFFLLWLLGVDLPGAVTVLPADGEDWPQDPANHDQNGDEATSRREAAMRFSLAGVQLKFSAIAEATGGLTIPAKGIGGSWIIKLPSSSYDGVPENEYSMMTLAGLIGMDVPAVSLTNIKNIQNMPGGLEAFKGEALIVERFDRTPDGGKVHIEDFAQIFRVYADNKYDKASFRNIATVIGAEGTDADIAEFIRRLTFNTLIGNADMHLKNWSLIYPDRRNAALAPAYDFVSTIPYLPDPNAALKFSRTKRFDEFTEDELSHLAAKARLPEKLVLDTARETVALFHQHWQAEKMNLPMAAEVTQAIDRHIATLPMR